MDEFRALMELYLGAVARAVGVGVAEPNGGLVALRRIRWSESLEFLEPVLDNDELQGLGARILVESREKAPD